MKGYSLIEVLFALSLFSFTLLAYLRQTTFMNLYLQNNVNKHIAIQECLSLADLLSVSLPLSRRRIVESWKDQVTLALPKGRGNVVFEQDTHRSVVCWGNRQRQCIHHAMQLQDRE